MKTMFYEVAYLDLNTNSMLNKRIYILKNRVLLLNVKKAVNFYGKK